MKKNSKYGKLAVMVMVMLLAFTACGSDGAKDGNDTGNKGNAKLEQTLGEELLEGVAFKDTLEPVDEQAIESLYGIIKEQYTAAKVYMSSGATAEEIAIFRVDSDDKVDALEEAVKARIQDQKSIMQDYLPDEMAKLDNAIIESEDHYVVLCITDDAKNAQKIIDKSLS